MMPSRREISRLDYGMCCDENEKYVISTGESLVREISISRLSGYPSFTRACVQKCVYGYLWLTMGNCESLWVSTGIFLSREEEKKKDCRLDTRVIEESALRLRYFRIDKNQYISIIIGDVSKYNKIDRLQ